MTPPPDFVVVNGKIATGDVRRPWVTGVAIGGGVVMALGTAAEINKLVRDGTKVVDAEGQDVVVQGRVSVGTRVTAGVIGQGNVWITAEEKSG